MRVKVPWARDFRSKLGDLGLQAKHQAEVANPVGGVRGPGEAGRQAGTTPHGGFLQNCVPKKVPKMGFFWLPRFRRRSLG